MLLLFIVVLLDQAARYQDVSAIATSSKVKGESRGVKGESRGSQRGVKGESKGSQMGVEGSQSIMHALVQAV